MGNLLALFEVAFGQIPDAVALNHQYVIVALDYAPRCRNRLKFGGYLLKKKLGFGRNQTHRLVILDKIQHLCTIFCDEFVYLCDGAAQNCAVGYEQTV
jgi:hypothetical protein